MERRVTKVVIEGVLDANAARAGANRRIFDQAGTYVINLMSSPGAGKTTLLERTLEHLLAPTAATQGRALRPGVLEGDVQTSLDAARLQRFGVPVIQIITDEGFGGACHLDAAMVHHGLTMLPVHDLDLLIVENVGNLICPADFAIGEDSRVVVCSVTEGEEKPLKYPLMFRAADLVLINKVDLLPHLDIDLALLHRNLDAVNPGVRRILTSARTGAGIAEWCSWMVSQHRTGGHA